MQGAIDLLVVRKQNGKVVGADVIDYKYSSRTDGALRRKYSPQLALYKKVVSRIYKLPIQSVTTTIINIRSCNVIKIDG